MTHTNRNNYPEQIRRLREALSIMIGSAYWMSRSDDFGPQGRAHTGWLRIQSCIAEAEKALEECRGGDK